MQSNTPAHPNLQLQFDDADDLATHVGHLSLPVPDGHYDELRDGDGLRPQWRRFFEQLGADGLADLDNRVHSAARQIRDNGTTYNVYADANGQSRPWSMDILPFILDETEWQQIEQGVAQRASLLNAMLADLYGERRLLNKGLLPPALVFGHPGYLRCLDGFTPPGGIFLHIASFDLARGPDGQWCVMSQRTQAPSGLGYALENRMIASRLFSQPFRELRVQHVASTYRRLLDTLYQHCPPGPSSGAPRIVLWTPGPYNESYFEQVYLARYLGLTLVEGGDLTVRDDKLYLKTLSGLEPVQGVLRRLDDDFCDPLELRPDSTLGVPGLLQAVRAGNVLMANALGSSFLESPGLLGFLPAVSRELLGEELAMPSLASWWCGEQAALEAALPELSSKVIKPTYPQQTLRPGFEPVIGATTDPLQLDDWRARMQAGPESYTLQDYLPLSQAPTWSNGRIVPRATMLRVFAIADGNGGWHVMPGGLTRVASREQQVVSMQRGGSSMDTWVLTRGEVDTFSMLPPRIRPEDLANRRRLISSRAAENLFWSGRYTERAEYAVRLARQVLTWLNANDSLEASFLDTITQLSLACGLVPAGTPSFSQAPRVFERALIGALTDEQGAYSVAYNLAALARSAAPVRDRLSPEHARLVLAPGKRFAARLTGLSKAGRYSTLDALSALELLAIELTAITGEQADHMTRDDGWRLLTIGRYLERLDTMSSALLASFQTLGVPQGPGFDLLVGAFDCTITYRSYYQRRQEIPALLDLLVCDPANPRSLHFILDVLHQQLEHLPDPTGDGICLGDLLPVGCPDLVELCERDDKGRYARLEDFASLLRQAAAQLSTDISLRYFSHAEGIEQALSL